MTDFLDGPAKGKTLMLKSAAYFLRVTEKDGEFDALDQWEDLPRPGEKLYAYEIAANFGMCHVRMTKGSGFYAIASYRFCPDQPSDEIMRSNALWAKWKSDRPRPNFTTSL